MPTAAPTGSWPPYSPRTHTSPSRRRPASSPGPRLGAPTPPASSRTPRSATASTRSTCAGRPTAAAPNSAGTPSWCSSTIPSASRRTSPRTCGPRSRCSKSACTQATSAATAWPPGAAFRRRRSPSSGSTTSREKPREATTTSARSSFRSAWSWTSTSPRPCTEPARSPPPPNSAGTSTPPPPLHGGELPHLATSEIAQLIRPGTPIAAACLTAVASCPGVSKVLLATGNSAHWTDALAATRAEVPRDTLRTVLDVLATRD